MTHHRANLPNDAHGGLLRPAHRQFERADGVLFNLGGASETQGVRAPYRRVQWLYRVEGDALTLHSPSGLMQLDPGLLSECRVTVPIEELPVFSSAAECESASEDTPIDLGPCGAVVPAFPFDDPEPTRFIAVLEGGGELFRVHHDDAGAPSCVRWQSRPASEELYFDSNDENGGRIRTTFGFMYLHHVLTLTGPRAEALGPLPAGSSLMSMGCAESFYVRHVAPDTVTVAGERWFFDRAACEAAMSDAPPLIGTCRDVP